MGIIIFPCDCSGTVTAATTTTTGFTLTLNANICPSCFAGGTLNFTFLDANQIQILNFTATTIRPSSCVFSNVRTILTVSGEGIAQDSSGTNPATFVLHLLAEPNGNPQQARIEVIVPTTGFTNAVFSSNEISELTITDCPSE